MTKRQKERASLGKMRDVIALWSSRYDTAEIAKRLDLDEWIVAKWIAGFRDTLMQVQAPAEAQMQAAA